MPDTLSNTMKGLILAAEELERDAMSPSALQAIIRRGDFRPEEDEEIGYWFARFISVRESLWDVIEDVLQVLDKSVSDIKGKTDWKYFLVGYAAVCLLIRIDRLMLFKVADHSIVQRKLNEAFPEYRIPRKQYTRIFSAFVDQGNVLAIRDAIELAEKNRRQLIALAEEDDVGFLAKMLPELETSLNPSAISYFKRAWDYVSHKWRRRGVVSAQNSLAGILEGFGRTASEFYNADNKNVTPEILADVSALLRPGDVIVTRHRKALTNFFLPGFWPHSALYIGTTDQRADIGVQADWAKEKIWVGDLCVLEARKDGVKIRPLSDTFSVDVFAVLRPRLSNDSVCRAIERAVLHEGKMYNFDFDFYTSDRLVCTEVIYRAFDGLEQIRFPLHERASRKTLSAEDMLDYALDSGHFETIAVCGVKGSEGRLVQGPDAEKLLTASYRNT
jgi:uncharacterized protein YycO